ncbi:MAG TPA: amidohydrolase [Anaerolineales bacterium]|nr:amidohydrolase [Anaerolineales bacterium]
MQLLLNAHIHTLDPRRPFGQAIAIDQGRILAIGSRDEILAEFSGRGQRVDLGGRAVLPGLTDAHIHLQQYAFSLQKIDCETPTIAECLRRVAELAHSTPAGQWILGHGWNQNDWLGDFGSASDLDAVAPDHPVYLTAKSLHAAWANSAAFQRAGINAQTADPPGGRFQRTQSGSLTGILFETAMQLVAQVIPEPSPAQIAAALRQAQEKLWQMGLTGAHDFDRQPCFTALQMLLDAGELGLRVLKSIPVEALPQAVELGLRSGFGGDLLRIGPVKIFADGALGPRTAAMFQPYEGEPENRGILSVDGEELFETGRVAVQHGLGLAVHAIGDRANHEVLNAFDQLRELEHKKAIPNSFPAPRLRHRIEHVQIIHPGDAPRLANLGLIASMQPIHATSDYLAADRYWGARASNSYAWRSLLNQGTRLAFGSDAPVDSPNPFWGLHAAVTRRRQDGSPGEDGWYPAQRLKLEEALHAYTAGAAYAAGLEQRLGMLAPGYLADLIVLDTDPFTCAVEQLPDIHPLGTMVGGNWVYTELPLSG